VLLDISILVGMQLVWTRSTCCGTPPAGLSDKIRLASHEKRILSTRVIDSTNLQCMTSSSVTSPQIARIVSGYVWVATKEGITNAEEAAATAPAEPSCGSLGLSKW
jgi:hypothetical protein